MEEKKGFFKRLVEGLTKTRNNIVSGIDSIFSGFSSIDDDFYDEIEEILIMGDLGINATTSIIEDLKRKVKEQHIKNPSECKELLIESIKDEMNVGETAYEFENRTSLDPVTGMHSEIVSAAGTDILILSGLLHKNRSFADLTTLHKSIRDLCVLFPQDP